MKIIKSFIENKIIKPELINKQIHFVTLCSFISHIVSDKLQIILLQNEDYMVL